MRFQGLSLPRNYFVIPGTLSREFLFEKFHGAGNPLDFTGKNLAGLVLYNLSDCARKAYPENIGPSEISKKFRGLSPGNPADSTGEIFGMLRQGKNKSLVAASGLEPLTTRV